MFSEAIIWSEYLSFARRKKTYLYRGIYLVVLLLITLGSWPSGTGIDYTDLEQRGLRMVNLALMIQFVCCAVFVAPHVANAIVQEKEQGTLGLLMISRLSSVEIAGGKLFARTSHVLSLLFYSLPFLILAVNIGGVSYAHLLIGFALVVCTAFLAGSIGLLVGVMSEGLLSAGILSYAVLGVLVAVPFGNLAAAYLPDGVMIGPGEAMWRLLDAGIKEDVPLWHYWLIPISYSVALSLTLTLVAVPLIGRSARRSSGDAQDVRQVKRTPRLVTRIIQYMAGNSEDNSNPVMWREVQTLAGGNSSFYMGLIVMTVLTCALSIAYQVIVRATPWGPALVDRALTPDSLRILVATVSYLLLVMVLLTATLVGALGFIREKQSRSIETLVLTPLNCEEIIAGKANGIKKFVIPFAIWPILLCATTLPSALRGDELGVYLCHTIAIGFLGLAVSQYIVYCALDISLVENRGFKAITRSLTKVLVFFVLGGLIAAQIMLIPMVAVGRGVSDEAEAGLYTAGISIMLGAYSLVRRRALLKSMVNHFEYYLGISETTLSGFRPPRNLSELVGGPGKPE